MTNLTEILARVSTLLMDGAHQIWPDEVLAESVRQALEEYNLARPRAVETTLRLETADHELCLSALTGFREILSLYYPWQPGPGGERAANQVRGWHTWFAGGLPYLVLRSTGCLTPGGELRVIYEASHTLAGLDGATETSIPAEHNGLLVRGSAGLAALSRGVDRIETRSYGSRRAEPEQLSRWGASQLASFRASLALLRQSLPPYPTPHWRMDRWESPTAR